MSECKDCKRSVRWVKTENGKAMPLDMNPVWDGNVVLIRGLAHVLKKDEKAAPNVPKFMPHMATCPARHPK